MNRRVEIINGRLRYTDYDFGKIEGKNGPGLKFKGFEIYSTSSQALHAVLVAHGGYFPRFTGLGAGNIQAPERLCLSFTAEKNRSVDGGWGAAIRELDGNKTELNDIKEIVPPGGVVKNYLFKKYKDEGNILRPSNSCDLVLVEENRRACLADLFTAYRMFGKKWQNLCIDSCRNNAVTLGLRRLACLE